MKRELYQTEDGSMTLRIPEWDEQYHSKHGAVQEALHVFIKSGLNFYKERYASTTHLSVLEIGFGTGLNALLTALFAKQYHLDIEYTGLEAYPVTSDEWKKLNYSTVLNGRHTASLYAKIMEVEWEKFKDITVNFKLHKREIFFQDFKEKEAFDLIFFDAFGSRVQPELWEEWIFENMYTAMRLKGVFVTYSAKGSVRRALKKVGFEVEKIPGPPGKREMLRAIKN